jgi:hypothetical protein
MAAPRFKTLAADRQPLARPPVRRVVNFVVTRKQHRLIDPAQPIDGNLFDEQFFDHANVGHAFVVIDDLNRHNSSPASDL